MLNVKEFFIVKKGEMINKKYLIFLVFLFFFIILFTSQVSAVCPGVVWGFSNVSLIINGVINQTNYTSQSDGCFNSNPNIFSDAPVNNTTYLTTPQNVSFTCRMTDVGFTFYRYFNNITFGNGNYQWNCSAFFTGSGGGGLKYSSTSTLIINAPAHNFSISLNQPANNSNFSISTPDINFTVSGTAQNYSCNLFFNNTNVGSNSTVLNNTLTTITTSTLSDANYDYYVNCTAGATTNQSEIRKLRIDTTPPDIRIDSPLSQNYGYNTSLNLNYSVSDLGVGISSCWYNLINKTGGGIIISNTTIANCQNITFNVSNIDNDYNLTLYANDTLNHLNFSTVTFGIRIQSPSVVLNYPTDNKYFNNGNNIYINFTASRPIGIDTCSLYVDDFSVINYTWIHPGNGTMNFTILNFSEGVHVYNVKCNDTLNVVGWGLSNLTFTVDTIYPTINITLINTTTGSQTVNVYDDIFDVNILSCKYSIFNLSGAVDGLNNNVSFTCNNTFSATVTHYGTFNMTLYAIDKAGNENSSTSLFTTSATIPTPSNPGGGAPSGEIEKIPVISLKQPKGSSVLYNELERAIFYARINSYCSDKNTGQTLAIQDFSGECSLQKSDVETIRSGISQEGFQVTIDDLILFYNEYQGKVLEQTYQTLDTIKKYNLFSSVLGITNPMLVNPPRLDRPFIVYQPRNNITIDYIFTVNKDIRECSILSGENFKCELLTNSSVKLTIYINDTNFFDKIFQGEMSITSKADPKNIEVKRIQLVPRIYNLSYQVLGIPITFILVFIAIILLALSIFFIVMAKIKREMKVK